MAPRSSVSWKGDLTPNGALEFFSKAVAFDAFSKSHKQSGCLGWGSPRIQLLTLFSFPTAEWELDTYLLSRVVWDALGLGSGTFWPDKALQFWKDFFFNYFLNLN